MKYYREYFGSIFWDHLIIVLTHIEGKSKQTFEDNDIAELLLETIKMHFDDIDEDLDIPIIGIGKDGDQDYEEFTDDVMGDVVYITNNNDKLVWPGIKQTSIQGLCSEEKETETGTIGIGDMDGCETKGNDDLEWMNMYQQLIGYGFDEESSMRAAKLYPKDMNRAIDSILV